MAINEIPGGPRQLGPLRDDERPEPVPRPGRERRDADKVELSEEARARFESSRAERFERIRERIRSGFYDSDQVIDAVVEGVVRELRS